LKERLSGELRGDADISAQARSVVLREQEETGISGILVQVSVFEALRKRLAQAYPEMTLSKLLMFCFVLGFIGMIAGFMITGSLLIAAAAAALGFYIPMIVVNGKRAKRQRMLADQLPEALDFLSRVLRAGHSLSTGLQMMGEELPHPLAAEFARAYAQHSLGNALDDCLKDMSKRIESTDFAFFVTAVLIQRQTGGDLSEVLGNISGMIRNRIRLQQHVKAKTAEGRFTGYILAAFPLVMFFIAYSLNPDYAGVLIRTTTGIELLCTAFGLQLMGLYCIKKITTVTV
jgi:tight adherence protein B